MHRVNLELGKEETFSFYVLLWTDNGGKLIDLNHKLDIQTMTTDKKGSYFLIPSLTTNINILRTNRNVAHFAKKKAKKDLIENKK